MTKERVRTNFTKRYGICVCSMDTLDRYCTRGELRCRHAIAGDPSPDACILRKPRDKDRRRYAAVEVGELNRGFHFYPNVLVVTGILSPKGCKNSPKPTR